MLISRVDEVGCYIFIHNGSNTDKLLAVFVNKAHKSDPPDLAVCNDGDTSIWESCKEYEIPDGVFAKALCEVFTKLIEKGVAKPYVRKKP